MSPPAQRGDGAAEKLSGVLERIIYSNEETHWTIGELRPGAKQKGVTIVGALPSVQCGETLELTGHWTEHPVHGRQFKAQTCKSTLPASVYGIRRYLGSGLVKGIGKTYADKIVAKFGEKTFQIISEESARLREVEGIGEQRAKAIKQAWDEQRAMRELMVFLKTYGVTNAQCLRLIRAYGSEAKTVLQNEPYRVAREVERFGFKTCDQIALNIGFSSDAPPRLEAGLIFALGDLEDKGHTCWPGAELARHCAELLQVDPALLLPRLDALIAKKDLISLPDRSVQLPVLERAENQTALAVRLVKQGGSVLPPIRVDNAVAWAQEKAGFAFALEQAQALKAALQNKFSILTGGPGTGKTTILRALVAILAAKKARVTLAAPTGRAAQRLSESACAFASTIHRLLAFDPAKGRFAYDADRPLGTDFLIVDEASMLDAKLAAALLRAVPPRAHVLLVGDVYQLPSVGAGNVLGDLIAASGAAVTRLEKIFRQGKRSGIVSTAHAILQGDTRPPYMTDDAEKIDPSFDLHFVRADTPQACVETVRALCQKHLPRWYNVDPVMDVQVLAPMHRGTAGIAVFNQDLQQALNPDGAGLPWMGWQLRPGDKIIQTRNNYDLGLFNGDLGRVTQADPAAGTLVADFDGTPVTIERADLADVQPAYALSIHKSQGSEFPIVIVPLLKQHFVMLRRNLVYTAVTRGRKKVFIVGDPSAYAMAVGNAEATARRTDLARKLRESV